MVLRLNLFRSKSSVGGVRIYLASLILGITLLCYVIVIFIVVIVIVILLCDDCLQDISCLIAHQDHIVIHLD